MKATKHKIPSKYWPKMTKNGLWFVRSPIGKWKKTLPNMSHLNAFKLDGGKFCGEKIGMDPDNPKGTDEWGEQVPLEQCSTQDVTGMKYKGTGYKSINGGTSSTCCPALATNIGGSVTRPSTLTYDPNWMVKQPDYLKAPWKYHLGNQQAGPRNMDPCFRTLFGETKSCKTEFELKILKCASCDCKDKKGNLQLLKVEIKHNLLPEADGQTTPGCIPWFSLADTGIRNRVAVVRAKASDLIVSQCTKKGQKLSTTLEKTNEETIKTDAASRKVLSTVKDVASCHCTLDQGKKCPPQAPIPPKTKHKSGGFPKCPQGMKPILEWGEPKQCMVKTHVLPKFLNDLRIGFHAELFASIVTGGNALGRGGKQLRLSDAALTFLYPINVLLEGPVRARRTTCNGHKCNDMYMYNGKDTFAYSLHGMGWPFERKNGLPDCTKVRDTLRLGGGCRSKNDEHCAASIKKMFIAPDGKCLWKEPIESMHTVMKKWHFHGNKKLRPLPSLSKQPASLCEDPRLAQVLVDGERGIGGKMSGHSDPLIRGPLVSQFWVQENKAFKTGEPLGQHHIFSRFWTHAVNTSFPVKYITHPTRDNANKFEAYLSQPIGLPACNSGGWCIDPDSGLKIGIRKECNGKGSNSKNQNFGYGWKDTPLNMGLDILVENDSTFIMRQRMPGSKFEHCASRVEWQFCVCEGRFPDLLGLGLGNYGLRVRDLGLGTSG